MYAEKKRRLVAKASSSEHYVGYMPRDQHSERGLSLTASFDKQATSAVLDLEGDDGKDLHKSHKTKQWYIFERPCYHGMRDSLDLVL